MQNVLIPINITQRISFFICESFGNPPFNMITIGRQSQIQDPSLGPTTALNLCYNFPTLILIFCFVYSFFGVIISPIINTKSFHCIPKIFLRVVKTMSSSSLKTVSPTLLIQSHECVYICTKLTFSVSKISIHKRQPTYQICVLQRNLFFPRIQIILFLLPILSRW